MAWTRTSRDRGLVVVALGFTTSRPRSTGASVRRASLPAVEDSSGPPTSDGPVHPGLLLGLARLVAGQGAVMLGYALVTLVVGLLGHPNWGAVAIVVVDLVVWGGGLLWVSRRGLLQHKRWAFSPVLFTQLVFGFIAVQDLRSAENSAAVTAAWLLVLVSAVAALVMLFSAPVRHTLVPPPPG